MLNAGQYDQRVTLQRRSTTQDSFMQQSTSWTDIATVWAKARPMRGRDKLLAGQAQSTIDVQFCVRYRVDVDASCRVLWSGVPYDIQGQPANVNGASVELELNCTRGVLDARG